MAYLLNEVCNKSLNLLLILRLLNVIVLSVDNHDFTIFLPINPSLMFLMDLCNVFQCYSLFTFSISLFNSLKAQFRGAFQVYNSF